MTDESHSRVSSTERIILSPFAKEYRALGTPIGIHFFFERPWKGPVQFKSSRRRVRWCRFVFCDQQNLRNPFEIEMWDLRFLARFPSVWSFCGNLRLSRTDILRWTHHTYIKFRKKLWAWSHVVLLYIEHSTGPSEGFPDPQIAQYTMGVSYQILCEMCSLQTMIVTLSEGIGSPAPENASSFCVTSFGQILTAQRLKYWMDILPHREADCAHRLHFFDYFIQVKSTWTTSDKDDGPRCVICIS